MEKLVYGLHVNSNINIEIIKKRCFMSWFRKSRPSFESKKYTIEIDRKKQRKVLFNKVVLT